MIDFFALGLVHVLLALAVVRLMLRDDLDADPPEQPKQAEQPGD
jgi:hypothetical protein